MSTLTKIITLLKEQNKKQKDLMDYLGLGKSAFTGWKSGKNTSYLKHIGKIAEFLGVSADYLLGTEKENPSADNGKGDEKKYTVFAMDGVEGAHTAQVSQAQVEKLNELIIAARDLPADKIDMLLKMADSIK